MSNKATCCVRLAIIAAAMVGACIGKFTAREAILIMLAQRILR